MRILMLAIMISLLPAPRQSYAGTNLVSAREGEFKTLDPMQQNDVESALIISQLYNSLLTFNYLKTPRELVPDLLEKMPEKTKASTYLFTLKKGIHFSDDACFPGGSGRELTSADVIFSLKRYADAGVNTATFDILQGVIKGIDEFRERSKAKDFSYDKSEIEGLRVLDRYRFMIDFTEDSPRNLQRLAMAFVVPKEAVDHYGNGFAQHPVGTGPYLMATYSRRGVMTLIPRKSYHLPIQKFDRIELPLIEEAQPRLLKFLSGQIDFMRADLDTYTAHLEKSTDGYRFKSEAMRSRFKVETEFSDASIFLRFSFKDPLLGANKKLRQAIAMALNGQNFADSMYKDVGIIGNSIISPALAGSARDTGSRWYEYDPGLARKLLAEAGYPAGKGLPEIAISFGSASQKSRRAFEVFRNDLAAIGIKVQPIFHQTYGALSQNLESGNFQIAHLSWSPYYPDAENLYALFTSRSFANYGAFRSAEFDRLYAEAKDMANGPSRYRIFAKMDQILKDEAAFAMPLFRSDIYIGRNQLTNFRTRSFELMKLQ